MNGVSVSEEGVAACVPGRGNVGAVVWEKKEDAACAPGVGDEDCDACRADFDDDVCAADKNSVLLSRPA